MEKVRQILTTQTADGHKAIIVRKLNMKLTVTKQYWIEITHKESQEKIYNGYWGPAMTGAKDFIQSWEQQ